MCHASESFSFGGRCRGCDRHARVGLWIVRDTARIDKPERAATPIGASKMTVARRPCFLRDDRRLAADDAIEERGFSDVGPSEERDDGNTGRAHAAAVPSRAMSGSTPRSPASTSMKSYDG